MGEAEYLFLARILAWFHTEYGVPLTSTVRWLPYPQSYGKTNGQRLSGPQYDAYRGILGHQHVSSNDHGDPGRIDIAQLLDLAKALVLDGEPNPKPPTPPAGRPTPQPWRPGDVLPSAKITTPFGVKGDWQAGFHTGDDWNVGDGGEDYWFPVYAPKSGQVTYVGDGGGWGPAYGRQVHIVYADGRIGMFAHLSKAEATSGQRVTPGTVVGRVGYSGNVRPIGLGGTHLHYEERVAPYRYGDDARPPVYVAADKPDPEPTPAHALRVATWNTRRSSYAPDKGTPQDWTVRDDLARDFLLGIPGGIPDVLMTVETTRTQTDDIGRFTGLKPSGNGLGGHPKDVAGDNTAVFINDQILERLTTITVNSGGTGRRFITAVKVKVKATGATLWFGATHLTSGAGADRAKEIRTLLAEAQRAGVDLALLTLGGDINESAPTSDATSVRAIADSYGLDDIRDELDDDQFRGDSWDTFTGWDPDVEKNGRHLDAILIGRSLSVSRGEIVPVINGASDHQLILAEITPKGDPEAMTELTIWTAGFWKATGERAVRTAAGALLALVAVAGFSPRTADWTDIAITVGLATVISVLFAISSNGVTKSGPALTDSEQVVPPQPQPKDRRG